MFDKSTGAIWCPACRDGGEYRELKLDLAGCSTRSIQFTCPACESYETYDLSTIWDDFKKEYQEAEDVERRLEETD